MMRHLICLSFLLCLGLRCLAIYQTNCPQGYRQYGERTCFGFFRDAPVQKSFQQSSNYCVHQDGKLLTISDPSQYNITSMYLQLYGNSESFWIGLRYQNDTTGAYKLTDVDGNFVNGTMFDLQSFEHGMGDCIAMMYSDHSVKFMQEDCSHLKSFACLMEWPAPPNVSISSSPNGYGIIGEEVNLTCAISPVTSGQPRIQWRVNGSDLDGGSGYLVDGIAILTISAFQLSKEGIYSCVVKTQYWNISSDSVRVKTAVVPSISRPPMNVTVYADQQGFVECMPDNNSFPEPLVVWYRNGTILDTTGQHSKYFMSPNTKTLLLSQTNSNDTGGYHCMLTSPAGSFVSEPGYINVVSPLEGSGQGSGDTNSSSSDDGISAIEMLLSPQPLTVFVGEDATFDCVISEGKKSAVSYKWIAYGSDGVVLDIAVRDVPGEHSFSSQTYHNVQLNHIVMVECTLAANTTVSQRVTLEVLERAHVTNLSDDATVPYGTDFELTCTFDGTPHPMMEWLFNGEPIEKNISIMTIKNFQPSNVGVYQCCVSNDYSSDIKFVTLYGKDGQPGYVSASLFAMSKSEVVVNWFFITDSNSDPELIQFKVIWGNMNDNSTALQSIYVLPFTNEYNITNLTPSYHLFVTLVAITPHIWKLETPSPLTIYPFGNAPNHSPKSIVVLRYNNNTAMLVSWDPVTPNHAIGEGDAFSYEIEYRNKKIESVPVLEQVLKASVHIEGLYSKGEYEVRVRCVVMIQSMPLPIKYENGPWSDWLESDGFPTAAPIRSSSDDKKLEVGIPIGIAALVLVILLASCVTYRLWRWTRSRNRDHCDVAYSSMKNENVEEEYL